MNDNLFTFAIIGKPNNGKSSIISALCMDDTIEVADEMGTTKKASSYYFEHEDKKICRFYDTPGFEQAEDIIDYLDDNQKDNHGNKAFRDYLKYRKNDESFQKDLEILEVIINKCDCIMFVIDNSNVYDENAPTDEWEILAKVDKPKLVLFNQIEDNDYSNQYKEALKEFKLTDTYIFNPLKSNSLAIQNLLAKLYEVVLTEFQVNLIRDKSRDTIEEIEGVYSKKYKENIEKSAISIVDSLYEVLSLKYTINDKKDIKIQEKSYKEKIYSTEKEYKRVIEKTWGYYETKVIDKREEFDIKVNKESFGVGNFVAYLATLSFIDKRKSFLQINGKDYNKTYIFLNRSLGHLKALINHGHANKNEINIEELIEFKLNEKELKLAHESFVKDENAMEKRKKLIEIVIQIINEQIV